ncbi:hypothetical protein Rs2_24758 [Raphanus sativus]|nr:hypothetical protein Rs2_24758 [Raphanus sativus]
MLKLKLLKDCNYSLISGILFDSLITLTNSLRLRQTTTLSASKETAQGAAQYTKETAEAGKDKTGGFLSQTGEHVKQMAMGAADAVKHTFGMATEEDESHLPGTTTGTTRTTDTTHQTYQRK